MYKEEIRAIRNRLHLSQPEFGQLFGVHLMTVSKWERGIVVPNAYQQAMMKEFDTASRKSGAADVLKGVLIGAGIAAAIYLLLKHARNGL